MWTAADIEIVFDDRMSEGDVVTAGIRTPAGELLVIANIERYDRELVLSRLHIQTEKLTPNSLGWPRLRQLALAIAEKADVKAVIVKGATRTTGASSGRVPGELRFARAISAPR